MRQQDAHIVPYYWWGEDVVDFGKVTGLLGVGQTDGRGSCLHQSKQRTVARSGAVQPKCMNCNWSGMVCRVAGYFRDCMALGDPNLGKSFVASIGVAARKRINVKAEHGRPMPRNGIKFIAEFSWSARAGTGIGCLAENRYVLFSRSFDNGLERRMAVLIGRGLRKEPAACHGRFLRFHQSGIGGRGFYCNGRGSK